MSVCHICLDEMRTNLCTTNPCGHVFHRECLARWGRQSGRIANASAMKCPSCNTVTEGVIHIFVDFGSDVSSKPQSSNDLTNIRVMIEEFFAEWDEEERQLLHDLQAMVDDKKARLDDMRVQQRYPSDRLDNLQAQLDELEAKLSKRQNDF